MTTFAEMPRVFTLPPEAGGDGRAVLRPISWPIYSCLALDTAAIPRLQSVFNYVPGQTVSGAGAAATRATRWHTNLDVPSMIPQPRTFTVFAISANLLPLTYGPSPALDQDTLLTAVAALKQVDDATLIVNSMALQFRIGPKVYAEGPFWMFPANTGIGGVTATGIANTNAATSVQQRVGIHTRGPSFGCGKFGVRPPVLWGGQTFGLDALCEHATNPTPLSTRLIRFSLHGIYSQEVQ